MAAHHTITDEKRGHRPPLSPYEPTVFYGLKMPLSLKAWCIRIGPKAVRRILTDTKNIMEAESDLLK